MMTVTTSGIANDLNLRLDTKTLGMLKSQDVTMTKN